MDLNSLRKKLSDEIIDFYINDGIKELYPPQEDAINAGVLDGENLVIAIPTASGKTMIAELAMLNSIKNGGKAIYIVPLRALASEKYEKFKKFEIFGLSIGLSLGDYEISDEHLGDNDIIVATSEKVDSLMRNNAKWLDKLSVMVIDEIHLINDPNRGPTLEIIINRLKRLNKNIQTIGLSATIGNAEEIADWLNSKLILSDWRPIKLFNGVFLNGSIYFKDNRSKYREVKINNNRCMDNVILLVEDMIKNGGQSLVFANTRKNSERYAKKISDYLKAERLIDTDERIKDLSKKIREIDDTDISLSLSKIVSSGVAFHHAGLSNSHRKIIEEGFKDGILKVIVATPTLSAGVNLPARRVIISSYRRYNSDFGNVPIPVLDYKQMAGRAGRPGLDPFGEAIAISKSENELDFIFENYIFADPEEIWSKLGTENTLRSHILSAIISFAKSRDEVLDFLSNTFFAYQNDLWKIDSVVRNIIFFLEENGFIEFDSNDERRFYPTDLGRLVSRLYIDPLSASIMVNRLKSLEYFEDVEKDLAYLHIICMTPDMQKIYLTKNEEIKLYEFVRSNKELLHYLDQDEIDDWILSSLKTALIIKEWIDEKREKIICKKYNIGPGDLANIIDTAEWLTRALYSIAYYLNFPYYYDIKNLSIQVRKGTKRELMELVRLKNIGRVRARRLYNAGYRSIEDLKRANVEDLSKIKGINVLLASSILKELEDYDEY
ncbi:MAG: ATP-dependent DNA helicase [Candidatus Methanoliparum thermophilum]|uniref:ATP-dependent DNA helicase Hel308 n=1 Tax=Methanoliparum thermophilum TaxID=2491083 RepID=A0A520KTW3_METT2|nr:MAG: ATP-dependent DNA helicase [Candidatus Methanoliparum thermophilum]BDC35370.1 extensin [Candidatus Methanoliparum sp. LAM-1]